MAKAPLPAAQSRLADLHLPEAAIRLPASAAASEAAPDGAEPQPKAKLFRKRFNGPRISPEAAERQGRVTQRAWALLGGREGAMAFLNAHNDALGGRPLDLAVASEEACAAVERAIGDHAAHQSKPGG